MKKHNKLKLITSKIDYNWFLLKILIIKKLDILTNFKIISIFIVIYYINF